MNPITQLIESQNSMKSLTDFMLDISLKAGVVSKDSNGETFGFASNMVAEDMLREWRTASVQELLETIVDGIEDSKIKYSWDDIDGECTVCGVHFHNVEHECDAHNKALQTQIDLLQETIKSI